MEVQVVFLLCGGRDWCHDLVHRALRSSRGYLVHVSVCRLLIHVSGTPLLSDDLGQFWILGLGCFQWLIDVFR